MNRVLTCSVLFIALTATAGVSRAELLFVGSQYAIYAYDLEGDTSATVWSTTTPQLVDVGYDPQQDDVYYNTYQTSAHIRRFWRDVDPAQYHGDGSDTTMIKEVYEGGGVTVTFDAIDVTPGPHMAFQYRDPQSYSDYFVRYTGVIVRNVTTGGETVLYSVPRYTAPYQQGHQIKDVAIDPSGTYVYFTDRLDGTIKRVPLDASSSAETVLSGLSQPSRLDMYTDKFYWTESGTNQIRSSPLVSPVATTLLTTTNTPTDIAVGGGKLYWTSASDPVMQANLDGDAAAALGGNAPNGTSLDFGGPVVPEPSSLCLTVLGVITAVGIYGTTVFRRRRR